MSSILGHALAGATVFFATNRRVDRRALRALPIFVLLAISPDFDYFAIWLWGFATKPRVTHTLLFCVLAAFIAWRLTRQMQFDYGARLPFLALLAASTSHLVLDFWVGVHPIALLWPFVDGGYEAPFAMLPSAARLRHGNFYLWRNTLIELALLLPIALLIVATTRNVPRRVLAKRAIWVLPIWMGALVWSMSLNR
jgi:inner membrane protein